MMRDPSEDRLAFLRALYGAAPTGYWFVITTFPDGKSKAFPAAEPSIIEAAKYIDTVDDGANHVFTSMALYDHTPTRGRGTAADARLICALWCDVDVKSGASPDLDTARKIIDSIPLKPSLLTCSGGGLHGFYLLAEPLGLETDGARADVVDLLNRWKHTVMAYAAECGAKVDKGTFDIARVMRVSGTSNAKSTPPLPAYIIESNDVRYAESDFDPILRDAPDTLPTEKPAPVPMDDVDIRPMVELPSGFAASIEADARLRQTWNRARTDLTDQSASGYSLSLATQCVSLGLTDEQIAQVICTWRQRHGASEKAPKWYGDTVALARKGGRFTAATAEFIGKVESGDMDEKQLVLDGLSEMLGFKIDAIRRYGGPKKATYRVVFDSRDECEIGDADDFVDQKRWSSRLYDQGHMMAMMKKPAWAAFTTAALKVIEDIDKDEMSERAMALRWVHEYIANRKLDDHLTAFEAYETHRPYTDRSGRIHIYVADLLRSINKQGQKPVNEASEYGPAMRLIGAERTQADLKYKGITDGSARSAWRLPKGFAASVDE